jgi:hypothetical protein
MNHRGYLFVFPLAILQEDPVLLVPEDKEQKPYVAIIKVTHGITCYFNSSCVLYHIWWICISCMDILF